MKFGRFFASEIQMNESDICKVQEIHGKKK